MAYAKTDEDNRIIFWSREKLDPDMVEFENGEYVDETCTDGLEDFVIEDGLAVFSPRPEKEIARLKKLLSETDYITAKAMDALTTCTTLSGILTELAAIRSRYGDIIVQRKEWRARINELEGDEV